MLVDPPDSVEVEEGEIVGLECVAEAVPEASISWQQGSQPVPTCLEAMSVFNLSLACVPPDMPTLLLIREASTESEGQYSCIADNMVGSVRHEITVTLLPPLTGQFDSIPPGYVPSSSVACG